jgi:hypothetical protein
MSTLLVVAISVLLVQIIAHFWRKGKLSGEAKTLYNHAMLVGNLIVLFVLLQTYMKTKRVAYILPVVTYLAVYLVHGHDAPNTGEAWNLAGGIALGALASGVKL